MSQEKKNEEAKMTGFFQSLKSVLLTAKVIFRMDWKNIPAFVGNQIFLTVQPFVALYFSARILDALAQGADRRTVISWVIGAVASGYGIYLLERLFACLNSVEGVTLYWQLYQEMSRVMMRADYGELEKPDIRQAKERIERSTRMFWYGPWEVPGVLMAVAQGLTITISALVLAWPVFLPVKGEGFPWGTLGMCVFILVSVLYSLRSEKRICEMQEGNLEELAVLQRKMYFFEEYIGEGRAAKDIRLYRQQELIRPRHQENWKKITQLNDRVSDARSKSSGIRGIFSQAIGAVAYLIVGARAIAGIFSVGAVVQYVGAVMKLSEGIRVLVYSLQHIRMQGPHCQEYLDFIGEGEDKMIYRHGQDGTAEVTLSGNPEDTAFGEGNAILEGNAIEDGGCIEFEHVSFRYPGSNEWAVRDLSIRLEKGVHFAVVGRNGSGKTTFIKLLCRLYDPVEGRILLNGRDIQEFKYEQYQRLFAVVFQDFQLFAMPLGENVASAMEYDGEKVMRALDQAGTGQWARELPKGLEQPLYLVEKDGINISGGEAQKIAIARALYKDSPFVILDEPTAALDPLAEAEIYEGFREMVAKKGAVYISHRLSSCRFCDTIAVFDEGRLVQLGGHEELLGDEGGKYYELWNAQAQYYQ